MSASIEDSFHSNTVLIIPTSINKIKGTRKKKWNYEKRELENSVMVDLVENTLPTHPGELVSSVPGGVIVIAT